MDPLAIDLNEKIKSSSPAVFDCLSEQGREAFFPAGILSQSAEAKEKAYRFNATIGIALENYKPMHLAVTRKFFGNLDPKDIYTYAPPGGRPKLRNLWKAKIFRNNPSIAGKNISLPMVTSALTHGLSLAGDLFVGRNDVVIMPDKYWGVYRLNFVTRRNGTISTFPMFIRNRDFNLDAFQAVLTKEAQHHKKLVLLLSFPNNPTGYTPTPEEAEAIFRMVKTQAESGTRIVVVADDAYFGLFYGNSIKESLFSGFCDLHENILAIKLDGATKESYAWGFRTGFITYGTKTSDPDKLYKALEMKTQGMIRSTISSCNHHSQTILETILEDPEYWENLENNYQILKKRAFKIQQILQTKKFSEVWESYPFNSGYFMCLKLHSLDAEQLRLHLLDNYGIGTIVPGKHDLRIAFSCIEAGDLEELFELIYQAAKELQNRGRVAC